jgi:hypothetical protein
MKARTDVVWRMFRIWWSNGRCYDKEVLVVAGTTPRSKTKYYRPLVGFSFIRNAGKVHVPEGRILSMNKTLFFVVFSRRRVTLSLSLCNFSFVECWKEDTAILRPWSKGWGELRARLRSTPYLFTWRLKQFHFTKFSLKFSCFEITYEGAWVLL